MRDRPYAQDVGLDGQMLRTFDADVDDEELRWHRDDRDRQVTFLSGAGWMIQVEPNLPLPITRGMSLVIPQGIWHRLIRTGREALQCAIREL